MATSLAAAVAPTATDCGLAAADVYDWVRWAALPSVYGLSSETAATYLADGASGILFLSGTSSSVKMREYAARRLRRVAERLRSHDDYGVWLLWADALDQTHHRLRAQLGLSAVSTPTEPVLERQQGRGAVAADAVDYSAAVAADPKPALQVAQFAIVVMSAGRIVDKFVMSAPFSFDAVHAFASAFARGRLQRNSRLRAAASMMAKVITACLAAVVGTFGLRIRRRRESSASANAAISGSRLPRIFLVAVVVISFLLGCLSRADRFSRLPLHIAASCLYISRQLNSCGPSGPVLSRFYT